MGIEAYEMKEFLADTITFVTPFGCVWSLRISRQAKYSAVAIRNTLSYVLRRMHLQYHCGCS